MASTDRSSAAVILAAGKGTRMKSQFPKVLHPLMGRPMILYVIDACRRARLDRIVIIVGHEAEHVRQILGTDFEYVEQKPQLGTGHALMCASESLKGFSGDLLVLAGDAPFLTGSILRKLIGHHNKTCAAATLMTAIIDPPPAYGRIIRDSSKRITRIVEERDASFQEKKITEVNTSHYCFQAETVFPLLSKLKTGNDQGEYYLTDAIQIMTQKGMRVETVVAPDPSVLMGINSMEDLSKATELLRTRINRKWMEAGVTIIDPTVVFIEPDVKIGRDSVIYPFSSITGKSVIGRGCKIGPQVRLSNARIGNKCNIEFSVIENRKIEEEATIGPFAFIQGE
jgi:bifunctional UDP-N-acetylglucosamine pyrophosphorylase/glucosamine-1-phosphate N-acetyltransferase